MAKVKDKSFCIQRCLLEKLTTPLLNGVKRERRVNLQATRMTEGSLAKAVHTPKLACVGEALPARAIIGWGLLFEIFIDEGFPQGDPV